MYCSLFEDESSSERSCDVQVILPGGTSAVAVKRFQYMAKHTARITAVSPSRGGTAGGTEIVISGTNFK